MLVWIGTALVGFALSIVGSRVAVEHATHLARHWKLPGFVVGLTLLSIGTDLPEIANSIVASLSGNGDVNVGDSVGSAATQMTLVLGLLPFLARPVLQSRRGLVATGLLTAAALALGAALVADGYLGRVDAAMLMSCWAVAIWVLLRVEPNVMAQLELDLDEPDPIRPAVRIVAAMGGLILVAGGASIAVWGVVSLAEAAGVPAYIVSFFGASIGTSLPELVVDVTAIRRGQTELAIGDAFGSSLVDATLSIGIGPLIAPTAVTASMAVTGSVAAALAALAVTLVFSRISTHDWRSGLLLLILYGALYPVLL